MQASPSRWLVVPAAAIACVALAACADDALPPAQSPIMPPQTTTRSPASQQLVAQAYAVTAPAWREAHRAALTNASSSSPAGPEEMEARLDRDRNAALLGLLATMATVGGSEVVVYAFWLAENEAAPASLRRAALAVLVRHVDKNDVAARARAGSIWARIQSLAAPEDRPAPRGGAVSKAGAVVAGMAAGFRRCYNAGLAEDRNMKGSVRVTAKIDATGGVVSASPTGSGLSARVVACVVANVLAARFAPPEGGGATVVIPVTFMTKD